MKPEQITNQLWNRQLDLQVSIVRDSDIEFLRKQRPWRRAKQVLEIGTGNGEYLCALAKAFPKKEFLGVDTNASLVRRAIHKATEERIENVRFLNHDFFALVHLPPRYDLIVARLVVQHLPDLERFTRTVSELLNPGGTLIVVEAEDERLEFNPPVPKAKTLFKAIRRKQPHGKSPVDMLRSLRRKARAVALSVVRDDSRLYVCDTARKKIARRFISNTAALAQNLWGIDPKASELEEQLRNWQAKKGSVMSWACRFLIFKKRRWRWLAFFF